MDKENILHYKKIIFLRICTWVLGLLGLTIFVLTIILWQGTISWLNILISIIALISWFVIYLKYFSLLQISRLNYLLVNKKIENDILREIAKKVFDMQDNCVYNGIEFHCFVNRKFEQSYRGNISNGESYAEIEFFEDRLKILIGDYEVDYQDILELEEEFTYCDIVDIIDLNSITLWAKNYFEEKAKSNINVIKEKWLEFFAKDITKKELRKKRVIGKRSYLWNLFGYFDVEHLSGERAKKAFDSINNKQAYYYKDSMKDNSICFAEDIAENRSSKDFENTGEFLIVDKNYNWTYIGTHEEPLIGPFFMMRKTK